MDFKQRYNNTETSVKLNFLHSLLLKNQDLQNQFVEFCKQTSSQSEKPLDHKAVIKTIKGISGKFKTELETLDFEDIDWSSYVPRHNGYIEEYEACENFAEDQLTDIFNGWKAQVSRLIANGNISEASHVLLGAYDACVSATINGADDLYDHPTDNLLQFHKQLMMEVVPDIEATVKSDDQSTWAITAIFASYQKNHAGMTDYLKHFEPFMITLVENKNVADRILTTIQEKAIDEALMPGFTVKLYSFVASPAEWAKKAGQFLYDDLDVAQQLLDYYWINDPGAFLKHGKKLFELYPYELCDFFRERLFPMFDRDFFRDVLWFKTERDRTTALYEELREYLDDKDKLEFLEKIRFDNVFKVKVLEMEQRYDEILDLVRKEVTHTWNFPELITPILNVFPQEAFELIKVKITYTIKNERSRSSYKHICVWLKLALQIHDREDDTRHLIHELYNRKPALPALKEEMRMAGVVA
jgi:hypothetical protein